MDSREKACGQGNLWEDEEIIKDLGSLEEGLFAHEPDLHFGVDENETMGNDLGTSTTDLPEPPKRSRPRRARVPPKIATLRSKPRPRAQKRESPADAETLLEPFAEDLFAFTTSPQRNTGQEDDALANNAGTLDICREGTDSPQRDYHAPPSPEPYEQAYQALYEREENIQAIVSCLQNGNVDICSVGEKKKIVADLKERLKTIEGSVEALKDALKKLIKYTV